MELKIVPWPDKDFYGDGTSRDSHLTIELDGRPLAHKEFFESADQPSVVYRFHYICDHEGNGTKFKCLHAGVFDRKTRIEQESGYGNREVRHFDLRTSLVFKRLPDFKERDLQAEAAEKVWNEFPASVHQKYLSQAAPCDRNKDGTPNFWMIGVMGEHDLRDELQSMSADYYGEHITNSKFGVDGRSAFKNEEEALEAFWDDPRGWNIYKWDGKRWLTATMKKAGKGAREVQWTVNE